MQILTTFLERKEALENIKYFTYFILGWYLKQVFQPQILLKTAI